MKNLFLAAVVAVSAAPSTETRLRCFSAEVMAQQTQSMYESGILTKEQKEHRNREYQSCEPGWRQRVTATEKKNNQPGQMAPDSL